MSNDKYKKLSIIMPCYNCERTLDEAVQSINTQNFNIPYEIIMINDGSTDKTKDMIENYAKNDRHIKAYSHKKNMGGCITFNDAVNKAEGDVIFCLDSDNILAANSLNKMFNYLNEKKADGVTIYERRFFTRDKNKFKTHLNKVLDRSLKLEDLFDENGVLLDQFMFVKEKYYLAGGHPLHHGFTGQCFEVRYLANGFKVYTCPGTIFYHRQGNEKSWFERVYEKGVFSKNFYLIYEDIIHLFSDKIRLKILNYDIYKNSNLRGNNLKNYIINLYKQEPNNLFRSDKGKYMVLNGRDKFANEFINSNKPEDLFVFGINAYFNKNYEKSLNDYIQLLKQGFDTPVVYFNILRISMALSGKYGKDEIEENTDKVIKSMTLTPQKSLFSKDKLIKRVINKLNKIIRK